MLNPVISEASLYRCNSKIGIISLLLVKGTKPAGGASATALTSTSSHVLVQQTPLASSRGICPGYKSSMDYPSCDMKGAFVHTSSPYDGSSSSQSQTAAMVETVAAAENHPLVGGSMDPVDKQVHVLDTVVRLFGCYHDCTGISLPVWRICLCFWCFRS